ncbi:MAG: ROK family protein [Chitinivibrionales bacterium]|nr:ROK family protein [Chitinivibrionales bacterium]
MEKSAIGIDLGGTNLKGIVMNGAGKYRHLKRIPTEAHKGGQKVLDNIFKLIEHLIKKEGAQDHIIGVGLGTPGFVDHNGVVIGGAENLPGWKGTSVYEAIRAKFNLPAVAGNDVTVTTFAEYKFGAGRGIPNLVCLALGTGIGGGIVADDHLYKGSHGMAGEFGHLIVETNGRQCTCGLKGCVEQYASAPGIVAAAVRFCAEAGPQELTPFVKETLKDPAALTSKTVYEYVLAQDPVALRVHEYACEKLAVAIGIILNAFSPDRVVLGGGVMKAGRIIIDTVLKFVPRYCWPEIAARCSVVAAELGEDAGVLGAGAMVFEELNFHDRP